MGLKINCFETKCKTIIKLSKATGVDNCLMNLFFKIVVVDENITLDTDCLRLL
jgi:hypothetical protein